MADRGLSLLPGTEVTEGGRRSWAGKVGDSTLKRSLQSETDELETNGLSLHPVMAHWGGCWGGNSDHPWNPWFPGSTKPKRSCPAHLGGTSWQAGLRKEDWTQEAKAPEGFLQIFCPIVPPQTLFVRLCLPVFGLGMWPPEAWLSLPHHSWTELGPGWNSSLPTLNSTLIFT